MEVYILQHVHEAPNGEEDVKLIGVYSSEAAAQDAIGRLSMKPGFSDHPESFHVGRYEVDRDQWIDGFISWKEGTE
jgi:hypothetical protein